MSSVSNSQLTSLFESCITEINTFNYNHNLTINNNTSNNIINILLETIAKVYGVSDYTLPSLLLLDDSHLTSDIYSSLSSFKSLVSEDCPPIKAALHVSSSYLSNNITVEFYNNFTGNYK